MSTSSSSTEKALAWLRANRPAPQGQGQGLDLLGQQRRAVELDHLQRAMHLMDTGQAFVDHIAVGGFDISVQRRAGVLQGLGKLKGENDDQTTGIEIAMRAMSAPLRQIAANAGDEGSVVLDKVENLKGNDGYNAATGKYGDMLKMGILDPAKVTRSALQAAASIAGLMLTTEAMISEVPDENPPGMPGGGMPDMGGMGGMM